MSFAFLLRYPWGLFDEAARRRLDGTRVEEIDPEGCLMIAAPASIRVRVRRGRAMPEPEGLTFRWGDQRFRIASLPGIARARDREMVLTLAGDALDEIEQPLRHAEATPLRSDAEEEGGAGTEDLGLEELIDQLIDLVQRLLQEAPGRALGPGRLRWPDVAELWLRERRGRTEPHMALIVRHAETLQRDLVALAERPRRILQRVRRREPVGRIQELDLACVGWYLRQPGRTTAEKAGPEQRLLAVVRTETRDTLENRVLRSTLRLSDRAARRYRHANQRFSSSRRFSLVQRYGTACRRLAEGSELAGVRPLASVPTPNYPLLFHPGYRNVWQAYRELLREERLVDEAWRWQRRLWADIVRMAVTVSLERPEVPQGGRSTSVGLSPLALRDEQARGRWSELAPLRAVTLLDADRLRVVIETLDVAALDETDRHPALAESDWPLALGPTLLLRVQDLASGASGWLPIWACHTQAATEPDLAEMTASASLALRRAMETEHLYRGGDVRAHGLILASGRTDTSLPEFAEHADGIRLGVSEEAFAGGIYLIRAVIIDAVRRLFER